MNNFKIYTIRLYTNKEQRADFKFWIALSKKKFMNLNYQ